MNYPEEGAHFNTLWKSSPGHFPPIFLLNIHGQKSAVQRSSQHPQEIDWERNKAVIIHYYKDKGMTLALVRQVMENGHCFKASSRMYKGRFKRWGVQKYKKKERTMSLAANGKINEKALVSVATPSTEIQLHQALTPSKLPFEYLFEAIYGIYGYQQCSWAYDKSLHMLCNVKFGISESFATFNRLFMDGSEALIHDQHDVGWKLINLALRHLYGSGLIGAMDFLYSALSRFAYLCSRGHRWGLLCFSLLRCLHEIAAIELPEHHPVSTSTFRLIHAIATSHLDESEIAPVLAYYVSVVNTGVHLIPVWVEMWRSQQFIDLQKVGYLSQTRVGSLVEVSDAVRRDTVPPPSGSVSVNGTFEKVEKLVQKWHRNSIDGEQQGSCRNSTALQCWGIIRRHLLWAAETKSTLGDFHGAKSTYDDALELSDYVWGPSSPESIRTLTSQAACLKRMNASGSSEREAEIARRFAILEKEL